MLIKFDFFGLFFRPSLADDPLQALFEMPFAENAERYAAAKKAAIERAILNQHGDTKFLGVVDKLCDQALSEMYLPQLLSGELDKKGTPWAKAVKAAVLDHVKTCIPCALKVSAYQDYRKQSVPQRSTASPSRTTGSARTKVVTMPPHGSTPHIV